MPPVKTVVMEHDARSCGMTLTEGEDSIVWKASTKPLPIIDNTTMLVEGYDPKCAT